MNGTRTIFGELRRVFSSDSATAHHPHLAQLCVLYEDLRIETSAIVQRSMPELDILNPAAEHADDPPKVGAYRRHYFLRRSIATVREFAECLKGLRNCPGFQHVHDQSEQYAAILDNAVRFFSDNEQLRTARNNTGGHFSYDAARHAIRNLDAQAIGRLEFEVVGRKTNAKLHFSGELVATAFTRALPGTSIQDKIANVIQRVAEAYKHATGVVQVMVVGHLEDRFGR